MGEVPPGRAAVTLGDLSPLGTHWELCLMTVLVER
jgi:hypothetical protein